MNLDIINNRNMKKLIAVLFMLLLGFPAVTIAQTNFRHVTIDEAIELAKKEKKMVFIDFYTDWCGPCKMMANTVFPQKKVGDYFNANFVCIKLNAEKEGKDAAKIYNVKAYPTFLVLDTDKKVKMDIKGSMNADDFIAKVKAQLNPEMSPERMKERYESGDRTPELINNYVYSFLEKRDEKTGFQILNDYYGSLTDAQRMLPENFFIFGRYTVDFDDTKAKFLIDHCEEFDNAVRKQAVERAQLLYHNALVPYLSGYMFTEKKYDAKAYETLKNGIINKGFDKTYPYAPMFSLIECYAAGDYSKYLDEVEKLRKELDVKDFDVILLNLNRLLPLKSDKALTQRVDKYVRSVLAELRPNTIMLMGRLLGTLEEK